MLALSSTLLSCSTSRAESIGSDRERIVYDNDDRRELFELEGEPVRALFRESLVALIPRDALTNGPRYELASPSSGEANGLCDGEPFANQPAAAFCTGVLVDWDLVLTAGHCTRLLRTRDYVIAFDYFNSEPNELNLQLDSMFGVDGIVAERLDAPSAEPRLDFAWLRLDHPALHPRRPARLSLGPPRLADGDPLTSIGTPDGTPLKVLGGAVRDARAGWFDYFTADTDTSHGASGATAFDSQLSLVGVLARGGNDYVVQPSGCLSTNHVSYEAAAEQFTYLQPAIAGLCEQEPERWPCQSRCETACSAPEPPERGAGCSVFGTGSPRRSLAFVAVVVIGLRSRQRQRCERTLLAYRRVRARA